jgi:ankyrin repeat protein
MASLTPEQKGAEMAAERSVLARLFASSVDDFDAFRGTIDEYTRLHGHVSASDVLRQFKDANHRTVLHFACRGTVLDKVLLADFVDASTLASLLRSKDRDGMTPLMLAAQLGDRDLAERNVLLLLESAGEGPKLGLARSHAGATALHYAAGASGTGRCVRALHGSAPIAIRSPSRQGGMPLHWACAVPRKSSSPPPPEISGGDSSADDDDAGETIGTLLDCGADVNAAPDPVPPPLHVCLAAGRERLACLILERAEKSAVSLQPTLDYELPGRVNLLHMAADLNAVGFLRRLLDHASRGEEAQCLSDLLERRSDQGLTPLEVAAREGHVGCVLLLLPEGPDRTEERARALVQEYRDKNPDAIPESGSHSTSQLPPKPESKAGSEPDAMELQAQEEASALMSQALPATDEMKSQAERFKSHGNERFAKKNYEEACDLYGKAIAANPGDATYYSNRSACLLLLGQAGPALRDATVARALRPEWPKAAYRVSAARLALGRYEDAAVAAWEGLALDNSNEELKSLLRKCVKKGRQEHLQSKKGDR